MQLPSIQENQQIALNAPALSMQRPADTDPLVLIANIIQNGAVGAQPTDSTFVVYGRNNSFGNGTQTIRIRKAYWMPPSQMTGNKPTKVLVDAYELTVKINAALPTVSQGSTSPGTVGPGTVATGGTVAPVNVAPLKEVSKTPAAPAKTLTAPTAVRK